MRSKTFLHWLLLFLTFSPLVAGCGQTSMQPGKHVTVHFAPWTEDVPEYLIGIGDEVEVRLPFNAEFSDRVTVGPDGRFTLPLVGGVRAEGRTVTALTAELETRYAKDIRDPRVQVTIRNYISSRFFIGGEVNKPGVYNLQGRIGVLEAITIANGSMDTARMSQVVIIRRNKEGQPMMRTVDLTDFIRGSTNDVPLQALDIVFVPKSTIAELNQFVDQFITRVLPFQRSFIYTIGQQRNYF
jgi:protein involved in polysaccharide export with SLBB domain